MRIWMRRGPAAWMLTPVALLFLALVALRRRLYRAGVLKATRLPAPVIVVGNIFVGGTGKTPLTIWLVDALRRAGYTPGVVSRGYGTHHDAPRAADADSSPHEVGDEPLLIARRAQCPVMVGADRVATANALLAARPEIDLIISDDGLQHYRLHRDIEIVLCDERGNGNGWLLPAGPLREPSSRPRDFTVFNAAHRPAGVPDNAFRMQLRGEVAEQLLDRSQRIALSALAKSSPRIVAAAGIGNPRRFFFMLAGAGLAFDEMPLPDHHDFADNPFAHVQADIILITEKDAVKCMQTAALKHDPRLWVVPVSAHIDGALAEQILEKCRGCPTA
jgi:tetraacyldisaccharide 4'-kinase